MAQISVPAGAHLVELRWTLEGLPAVPIPPGVAQQLSARFKRTIQLAMHDLQGIRERPEQVIGYRDMRITHPPGLVTLRAIVRLGEGVDVAERVADLTAQFHNIQRRAWATAIDEDCRGSGMDEAEGK